MLLLLSPLAKGFMVGAGLIVAIGPQNMFVINQGVRRRDVLLTAIMCVLIDAVLFTLGVVGLGGVLVSHPMAVMMLRWFGAVFLTIYAMYSLWGVFHPQVMEDESSQETALRTRKQTVFLLLGLGFLNPHAYLDTLLLGGSIAIQQPGHARYVFGAGLILASLVWFFTLAYGARSLSHLFKKKIAWRILNATTSAAMLAVAISLVWH